jgi:hypothetical protein
MMRKIIVSAMLLLFLVVSTGCVVKGHVPPGQIKKQSAPGQMNKHR